MKNLLERKQAKTGKKYELTIRMEVDRELDGGVLSEVLYDAWLRFCAKSKIDPSEFITAETKLQYGWNEDLMLCLNAPAEDEEDL